MKTVEERAREHLGRWEKDFHADLDAAVTAALVAHESDVRADERCAAINAVRAIRTEVAKLSPETPWTTAEVLEEIDGMINDIAGNIT